MKKIVGTLLLAALVVSLTACGGGEQKASEAPTQASQESKAAESSAAQSSEAKKDDEKVLELGKKVEFDTFDITIKSFSIVKDTDGKPVLKYVYDWTNKDKKAAAPFMTFGLKGFQDGVETDNAVLVMEGVDLGIGQKEVKSGATIKDAEGIVGITAIDKPLDLELDKLISMDSAPYKMTIKDLSSLKK